MAKEYFSHDYNARNDRKISALVKDYKSAGYGIFWCACELMHEEGGSLEFDDLTFGTIAKDLNEDEKLIKEVLEKCINKYKLFEANEALLQANESPLKLTSNRVKRNLNGSEQRKLAKALAGRVGGINSGLSRKSKQNEAALQANEAELEATKQRRVKESKEKERESNEKTLPHSGFEIYNAEELVLSNQIEFERICMATSKTVTTAKSSLRNYHLYLEEKEQYPKSKRALFAGFEKWLRNERSEGFSGNGQGKKMVL